MGHGAIGFAMPEPSNWIAFFLIGIWGIILKSIMDEKSDKQLAGEALSGDKKSLEVLIGRYLKPLYGFVYRMTEGSHDTEDIVQEAFVKAWKKLKSFDPEKSFKVWVFAIAKNTAIDHLRKKKHLSFAEFDDEEGKNWIEETFEDSAPLPPELFERKQLKRELGDAMGKLSAKSRMAVLLHYQDGMTFGEIGEVLGEPLDTVKSRVRRALMALKGSLIDPR
jgi:RNA polymerase sigma-70 factor (ECF subfamily)